MSILSVRALLPLVTVAVLMLCGVTPTLHSSAPIRHSYTCRTEKVELVIPAQTLRYACSELAEGEEKILSAGRDGLVRMTYAVSVADGVDISRDVVSRQVLVQKTDRVILYGLPPLERSNDVDPPPNTVMTASGELLTYSRKLSVIATAYSCEGYAGITAIGTTARVGAIAVDPKVIPYGTKMYVVSDDGEYIYGFAVAEDCGNFRGYQIDLYFNTVDECWQFGSRRCTVYILD